MTPPDAIKIVARPINVSLIRKLMNFKSNNKAPAMIKYTAICLDSMLFPFIKIVIL